MRPVAVVPLVVVVEAEEVGETVADVEVVVVLVDGVEVAEVTEVRPALLYIHEIEVVVVCDSKWIEIVVRMKLTASLVFQEEEDEGVEEVGVILAAEEAVAVG